MSGPPERRRDASCRVAETLTQQRNLALKEGCDRMRTIDFSPLYRSVVGFDRLANLLDSATAEASSGYPPYNIERLDEASYRIDIAVAGFRADELDIQVKENLLTVT